MAVVYFPLEFLRRFTSLSGSYFREKKIFDNMPGIAEWRVESEGVAIISIAGTWSIYEKHPHAEEFIETIVSKSSIQRIDLTFVDLKGWDSVLINFLIRILTICESNNLAVNGDNIPIGIRRLIELSKTSPVRSTLPTSKKKSTIFEFAGGAGLLIFLSLKNFLGFMGKLHGGIISFIRGKVKIRGQEFAVMLQDVGVKALPIVALISFLVGLIIAFVSVLQLSQFGANIYVADLVGISMMREMGSIMTGIIMSGRTGAAFAATIGTMVVNDEVDALQTAGFSSIDFLVLPRVLALTLMMPLLCAFSSFIGITGGACATMFSTSLTIAQYCIQTAHAVCLNDFFVGIIKSCFFGFLVATIGCQKGLQCERSAEDVGITTTTAVVTSITAIIIMDAIFAVVFSWFGI
ncbi:MAG: ABC transporter permease [Puniceicoccales bacterium]|jgi:phospholipid/cholesterol/gamma-HCH transport system permease protein|nr:ABC transporter permease [Puniceicoccales bacterium]